jgi:hypothetical protein
MDIPTFSVDSFFVTLDQTRGEYTASPLAAHVGVHRVRITMNKPNDYVEFQITVLGTLIADCSQVPIH